MKIATWNLARPNVNGVRGGRLRAAMNEISPDVWVLTETRRDFTPGDGFQPIACSLPAPDRDAQGGECWVAIWSRVDGIEVKMHAEPERTAAIRLMLPCERTLVIIGMVLPWLSDGRHKELRGAAAFTSALRKQAKEWRSISAAHRAGTVCVIGGFNQDLAPRHYYGSIVGRASLSQEIKGSGLRCLTAGEADPVSRMTSGAAGSVNHICVSESEPNLTVGGIWPRPAVDKRLTDHFGVWAEVG